MEWKWILILIGAAVIGMVFTGHLDLGGSFNMQSVIGTDCPAFKTNANGMYASPTAWIATDCNGDNVYERYGYYSNTPLGWAFTKKGLTPDGWEYMCMTAGFPSINYVAVRPVGNTGYIGFKENYGAYASADITCEASPPPTTPPPSFQFTCIDTNPTNSKVDKTELLAVLQAWIGG